MRRRSAGIQRGGGLKGAASEVLSGPIRILVRSRSALTLDSIYPRRVAPGGVETTLTQSPKRPGPSTASNHVPTVSHTAVAVLYHIEAPGSWNHKGRHQNSAVSSETQTRRL